jgi:peptidoglycan/xylan/chitin deacetylase (PgdA/CDA1 family)
MILSITKTNESNKRINIVFRFDDYKLCSTNFYDSLFYTFKKNNIPLCLGIIPFDKKGLFYNELNQEQIKDLKSRINNNEIEIALHGFNHGVNKINILPYKKFSNESEFVGLDFKDQIKKIKKGKISIDSLLNIKINIFIPPYNSYDETTLEVLDSLKFQIISAIKDGPHSSTRIKYIPYTINDLNELPKVVKAFHYDNGVIVVLFHSYSIKGGGNNPEGPRKVIDFKDLDLLLGSIKDQTSISTTTFSKLNQVEIFDEKRFVLNSTNNNLLIKLLYKLKLYNYGVYLMPESLRVSKYILDISNVFLHIIIFIIIYYTSKVITKLIKPPKTIIFIFRAVIVLMFFGILYKISFSHNLFVYIAFIITILTAMFLGINRAKYNNDKILG